MYLILKCYQFDNCLSRRKYKVVIFHFLKVSLIVIKIYSYFLTVVHFEPHIRDVHINTCLVYNVFFSLLFLLLVY
jgi:hypothetical protein